MILAAMLVVWVLLFAWTAFLCWRAPVGYEDAKGFHFGVARESDVENRREAPARRRARRTAADHGRHITA